MWERLSAADQGVVLKALRWYRTMRQYIARRDGHPEPAGVVAQVRRIERALRGGR